MSYEYLFSPMNIGSMTVKNRVVMTPAEMSLARTDGRPSDALLDYFEARAKGGVGLIFSGITRVNNMAGTSSFTQLSMAKDWNIEPMRELVGRVHKHGAKFGVQLHHPGRQGYGSAINLLPAVIPVANHMPKLMDGMFKMTPALLKLEAKGVCQAVQAPSKCERTAHGAGRIHGMSKREIHKLQSDFIAAALRCKKAGVDAVELHAGHGYLIQQFLSPVTNLRTDEYGGSLENRMRFLLEIVSGIREQCGEDYPLLVRLSVDEMYDRIGQPGKGYGLEEGKRMAKMLETAGIDAIDVTSAGYDTFNYWLEPSSFEPGWRAYLAKEIKSVVSVPVIAANFIRSPEQAERQIAEGWQDFMGSARSFICDPDWVNKVQEGRENEIRRCIGCTNCVSSLMTNGAKGLQAECALNPLVGKETKPLPRDGAGRTAVVVGAGPAGLTAAWLLLERGFKVTVFEKEDECGGQINAASAYGGREKIRWCIDDLRTAVEKLGGEVRLGTEATAEAILAMAPAAVIIAAGGVPVVPRSIPGSTGENVLLPSEVIFGKKLPRNENVLVAGSGLTGLGVAEVLCEAGNRVTVLEMADSIAPGAWFQLVDDEMQRMEPYGVNCLTSHKLLSIADGKVTAENIKEKKTVTIEAEHVVLSLGVRPVDGLFHALKDQLPQVKKVGDADRSGTIAHAVKTAYDAVAEIK